MKNSRFTETEILSILVEADAGRKVSEICRTHGISDAVFYNWKAKYGGTSASDLKRMKELELELARLKRMHGDLVLENEPSHASLAPHRIVPGPEKQGAYVASELTFYRVLKPANQQYGRGRARRPRRRVVTTHRTDGSNPLWCWNITWLPTTVKRQFFAGI